MEQYDDPEFDFNVGLVITELERRFILFLIGGEYERMFYSLVGSAKTDEHGLDDQELGRIRLEVEISESERRKLSEGKTEAPEYKRMLDYILNAKIKKQLEQTEDLLQLLPEFVDLLPILEHLPEDNKITDAHVEQIKKIAWLKAQIETFLRATQVRKAMNLPEGGSFEQLLKSLSFPQVAWLLPNWVAQEISERIHPSLEVTFRKVRFYGRIVAGAIGHLVASETAVSHHRWKFHALGGLNCVPLIMLLVLVSNSIDELLKQQSEILNKEVDDEDKELKLAILRDFQFSPDSLRDLLQMEEIVKPHLLEQVKIPGLDPIQYISGFGDEDDKIQTIFKQARAYAFYRQLYRTKRIKKHEAGTFLRRHNISKSVFEHLNGVELAALGNHIDILERLLKT